VGAARHQLHRGARRVDRHHRPQRRWQEHAAQADHRNDQAQRGRSADERPRRGAPGARDGLPPRVHRARERADDGAADGAVRSRNRLGAASDRSLRRDRPLHRRAAAHLFERHAGAAGLQCHHGVPSGHPDRRRGAGGRRSLFPAQVLCADPAVPRRGHDAAVRLARSWGDQESVRPGDPAGRRRHSDGRPSRSRPRLLQRPGRRAGERGGSNHWNPILA
jgi:hypothetical protein